uniref:NADH-ubiquinone oxidoreductase chain 2 n=5 Tax=Junonia TaxID=39707 RepID=A0A0P0CDN6_JUNCO|nr:NADH dehydrogenase subunit 2 [Junonia coenia]YP_010417570.1 NADH dehydrogenase subunit 2 [Junonia nigrosuffusa]ANZ03474.1 NADH dehydrogenase subunit 2 [Junonia iphita]APC61704.1 NADH dehydrogenase subunit 2 [Junonia coenia bergi]ARH11347.1 NADH dehydrogenase subunit 2 [Junonia litoralis]ARH11412.1 NADH dehydrogenase subunit 2 [Junonia zonalis]ALJ01826.1 NADH dehydrogenase subunit 2 [Junonia coenia]
MLFMINSNKMFFLFIVFFSTLISISSNSWLGCWIGLEINLLSFIPLMSNPNNLLNSEASLKYFLTQSIASINFLFSILLNLFLLKNFFTNNILSILIDSSLLMKMGSIPFHFWFPNIMEGLSWFNCFILMTWQKISPMILLSYYMNLKFLFLIMILNVLIGTISSFNQTSLRKLMAFSSINNLGWMLSALSISENLWMLYFLLYSLFISIMCFLFYIINIFYINQLFNLNLNFSIKFSILINFLSLGGLPPFLGFFPKWMIINYLLYNNLFIISFIFTMSSLIMLFIYIRIIYSSFMFYSIKLKWYKIFIKNNFMIFINISSFISLLGMIISTLFFF